MNIPTIYALIFAVNALGFLATMLISRRRRGSDVLPAIFTLLGGAPGVLIAYFLFDRMPEKRNMLARVIAICALVCQLAIALTLLLRAKNGAPGGLSFDLISPFTKRPWLAYYTLSVNAIAFLLYGFDKLMAVRGGRRVRIVTLLGAAFLGGSVGALLAMFTLRHKTRTAHFTYGVPAILLTHIAVLFCLVNAGLL